MAGVARLLRGGAETFRRANKCAPCDARRPRPARCRHIVPRAISAPAVADGESFENERIAERHARLCWRPRENANCRNNVFLARVQLRGARREKNAIGSPVRMSRKVFIKCDVGECPKWKCWTVGVENVYGRKRRTRVVDLLPNRAPGVETAVHISGEWIFRFLTESRAVPVNILFDVGRLVSRKYQFIIINVSIIV